MSTLKPFKGEIPEGTEFKALTLSDFEGGGYGFGLDDVGEDAMATLLRKNMEKLGFDDPDFADMYVSRMNRVSCMARLADSRMSKSASGGKSKGNSEYWQKMMQLPTLEMPNSQVSIKLADFVKTPILVRHFFDESVFPFMGDKERDEDTRDDPNEWVDGWGDVYPGAILVCEAQEAFHAIHAVCASEFQNILRHMRKYKSAYPVWEPVVFAGSDKDGSIAKVNDEISKGRSYIDGLEYLYAAIVNMDINRRDAIMIGMLHPKTIATGAAEGETDINPEHLDRDLGTRYYLQSMELRVCRTLILLSLMNRMLSRATWKDANATLYGDEQFKGDFPEVFGMPAETFYAGVFADYSSLRGEIVFDSLPGDEHDVVQYNTSLASVGVPPYIHLTPSLDPLDRSAVCKEWVEWSNGFTDRYKHIKEVVFRSIAKATVASETNSMKAVVEKVQKRAKKKAKKKAKQMKKAGLAEKRRTKG